MAVTLLISRFLRPSNPTPEKLETYECGPPTFSQAWRQMNLHYYIFALMFVLFDVEALFLFPVALVAKQVGWYGFVETVIFIGILVAGLIYAWRIGGLEWER
jgi:NADH:ubiquinone oxidoreductase subunit 3 (subunit A)